MFLCCPPNQSLETLPPRASLCHDAEQLFCLSCLSNSFGFWETDKRPNLGCQSNVSRKGMCVKGISDSIFLFILFSWLWQDRQWGDPHVGLFMSGRIKSASRVLVPFAVASASVNLLWALELSEWVPPLFTGMGLGRMKYLSYAQNVRRCQKTHNQNKHFNTIFF